MQPNVETLIEAARHLPPEDRQRLAEALLSQFPSGSSPLHHITEIRGMGKSLWKGVDAQEYVDAERDSWDN